MPQIAVWLTTFRAALRMGSIAARHGRDHLSPDTPTPVYLQLLPQGLLRVHSHHGIEHSVAYDQSPQPPATGLPPVSLTPYDTAVMLEALDADTRPQRLTLTVTPESVHLDTPTPVRVANLGTRFPAPSGLLPTPTADPADAHRLPSLPAAVLRDIAADTQPGLTVQLHGDMQAPSLIGWTTGVWAYGRTLPAFPSGANPQPRNAAILHERLAALDPLPTA